jgi:hypothetical protein
MSMKQRMIGLAVLACLYALPAFAEQGAQDYHAPLGSMTQVPQAMSAEPRSTLPAFAVEPTPARRASMQALTFVSRVGVSMAAEQQGVRTPVASPSYQPYRPGVSVPEPATTERSCPPIGTANAPGACGLTP